MNKITELLITYLIAECLGIAFVIFCFIVFGSLIQARKLKDGDEK